MAGTVLRYTRWLAVALVAATAGAAEQSGKVEIWWLGQSATCITTPSGKVILIDPWIIKNPTTPEQYDNLDVIGKPDVILVTHAHGDHLGDAEDIAKKWNVPMWGPAGMNQTLTTIGAISPEQPDLIMIPIGGHYVLKDAAYVTNTWFKPKFAIPIHYASNPYLKGTPKEYMDALGNTSTKVLPMKQGDKVTF